MMDIKKISEYQYPLNGKKHKDNNKIHYTSIVILTYNQLEYTKLCIESIRKFTPKDKYELIVVDNNSSDGTVLWLKEQNDIRIILNRKNYGVAKGYNQGIQKSIGDNILLLNNDVIVTPNWLYNLDTALWSSTKIGAVSCLTNYASNAQKINTCYDDITSMLDFSIDYNTTDKSKYEQRYKLVAFCFLTKREVVDKVGLLDEQFYPGNFEDDDYCMRISKEKYKLVLCKDTFVHHFGSISFKNSDIDYEKLFIENREKFKDKWFR